MAKCFWGRSILTICVSERGPFVGKQLWGPFAPRNKGETPPISRPEFFTFSRFSSFGVQKKKGHLFIVLGIICP